MKILIISQFFSSTRGGGEYLLNLLTKILAREGNEVFVITNRIEDEEYQDIKGVKIIFVPPVLEYKGGLPSSIIDNLRFIFNAVIAGLRLIKNNDIQIIHSNNFSPILAGAMLSLLTSKPHVVAIWDVFSLCGNTYWNDWASQLGISSIHKMLGKFFEKNMLRLRHSAIHTVSDTSRNDLERFGAKKPIFVIPPAIDDLNDKQQESDDISTQRFHFVYVGRLVFYKNVKVLLDAVSRVKNTEPNVRLTIIGHGPQKQNLERLIEDMGISDNVEMVGFVGQVEKSRIIIRSNAMLFPSLCEGFGLVILEAFAHGRAIVVSDVEPVSSIVQHGNTGFVADPHDAGAWATYMERMICDPHESQQMGENGKRVFKTEYTQKMFYDNVMNMYRVVMPHNDSHNNNTLDTIS